MSDPTDAGSNDAPPPDRDTLTLDLEPAPKSRTGYIVVAGILVAIVLVVLIAVIVGRRPSGYSAEDKQMFLSACTAGGGDPVKDTCGCIYDQMSQKVPYERYVAIDAELQTQRAKSQNAPLQFPAEVEAIRVTCVGLTKPEVKEPPTSQERPTIKEPPTT